MFSFHNATSVILSIAKVLVLLTLIGLVVKNDAGQILAAGDTTPAGFLASCSSIVFKSSFVAAVTFLVFAGIDYWRQWLRHEQQIKMTPQEFRDEMRESQGDPQMAATRRVLYEQVNSIGQTNVGLEIADSRQRRHSPDQRTNSGDSDLVSEK
jgi:flagellar biosynthetic protein FlhB